MIINSEWLLPEIFSYEYALVAMPIDNTMSKGFRHEISIHFPDIKKKEAELTGYCDKRKFGTIQEIVSDEGMKFIFCYCLKNSSKGTILDKEYLRSCFGKIKAKYGRLSSMPKICSILIGANEYEGKDEDHDELMSLMTEYLRDIDITVYDYQVKDWHKEMFKKVAYLHSLIKKHVVTSEEYIKKRSELEWVRRHGIFKQQPDNYLYYPRKNMLKNTLSVVKGKIRKKNENFCDK